jgi:hypothetical protein
MSDRRILVIANRTCPCPALADELAARAGEPPGDVLIVAPALNTRLRHWVSDVDAAMAAAAERLKHAVANLSERGVAAEGVVGDSDPLLAIQDALADFPATEIVLSTHPPPAARTGSRGSCRCEQPSASTSPSRTSSPSTGSRRRRPRDPRVPATPINTPGAAAL